MKLNFFIMTNTSDKGHTEYGNTEYFIAGQDQQGRRYRLDSSLLKNDDKTDRECRDIQNRRILRMLQAIAYGQPVNLDKWTQIEPAYNSEAFHKLDVVQKQAMIEQHEELYSI